MFAMLYTKLDNMRCIAFILLLLLLLYGLFTDVWALTRALSLTRARVHWFLLSHKIKSLSNDNNNNNASYVYIIFFFKHDTRRKIKNKMKKKHLTSVENMYNKSWKLKEIKCRINLPLHSVVSLYFLSLRPSFFRLLSVSNDHQSMRARWPLNSIFNSTHLSH